MDEALPMGHGVLRGQIQTFEVLSAYAANPAKSGGMEEVALTAHGSHVQYNLTTTIPRRPRMPGEWHSNFVC